MSGAINLCFKCAELHEGGKCPFCGEEHPDDYDAIVERAKQAYEMGINYRKFFEDQIVSEGKVKCYASLVPPEQWLVFIGVAALSGIIGNASYDLVKNVIKKIIEKAKKDGVDEIAKKFDSDYKIEILITHINEYINTPEKIHPEVLHGIKEEMQVDDYMYGFTEIMEVKSNKKLTPEKVEEVIKQIKDRKLKADSINRENFSHFWDNYNK